MERGHFLGEEAKGKNEDGVCCCALMAPHPFPQAHFPNPDTPDQTELTFPSSVGRSIRPMVLGLRYFVNTYGAMDMLFDISVEGMGTGRVGTGRLTTV